MVRPIPKKFGEIVKRYEGNPIITKEDVAFDTAYVLNTGAIKYNDKYLLLMRVQGRDKMSHLVKAISDDGINFDIDKTYTLSPTRRSRLDDKGLEDPRITKMDGLYYIAHTAYSGDGAVIALTSTRNFKKFKRIGIVTHPENKDGGMLPEKIKLPKSREKEYFLYTRPTATGTIWCCSSPDLEHWGHYTPVMRRGINAWSGEKVGLGAVPIKTEEGWLEIFHGVEKMGERNVYRLGVALFDLEEPWQLKRASKNYILGPETDYESMGGVPNVVFTCGAIEDKDDQGEDIVKIYYGAADRSICLATAKLNDLIDVAKRY